MQEKKRFEQPHNINTFIFDLDGTLLNDEHDISDVTAHAINELRDRGFNLVIATGRHINDIRYYLEQLGGGISTITCNGANIHDRNGELIYREGLQQEFITALIPLGNRFNVHTNIYTDSEWLVSAPCESILAPHVKAKFFYKQIDHSEMLAAAALKIIFYGENSLLQELKKEIDIKHSALVNLTFSDEHYLEVMQKNISKGHALKFLLNKLSLAATQAIAFGDGMNDIELLNTVAHPVTMGNSSLSLQALFPEAHRAQTNHNDGVARFLREHLL